uniref:7TM GPCR serpentine receptor class x (Srx) domain-containing protein n=1 Tax=Acrobeloides nanus TaxID=290746 RepID=A0A914BX71_9BILA
MYVNYLCMNTDMLIAVNRFTAIVFCNYYEWVFSPKNGWPIVLFGVALSLLKTIPAIIYGVKYYPELETTSFYYLPNPDTGKILIYIELAYTYGVHSIIFVL